MERTTLPASTVTEARSAAPEAGTRAGDGGAAAGAGGPPRDSPYGTTETSSNQAAPERPATEQKRPSCVDGSSGTEYTCSCRTHSGPALGCVNVTRPVGRPRTKLRMPSTAVAPPSAARYA